MAAFVVMQPPAAASGDETNPKFVRDGFHFLAFLFPPFWLFWHRLWLEGALALLATIGLSALGEVTDAGLLASPLSILVSIYVGLEGSALYLASLRRRGWSESAVIEAEDSQDAEARFAFGTGSSPAAPRTESPRSAPSTKPRVAPDPVFGFWGAADRR